MRKAITHKRLAALVAVLLSGLVLAGCVAFTGPIDITQQNTIGAARITFTICTQDGSGTRPGCTETSNTGSTTSENNRGQVMLGFRVPDGVNGPDGFSSSSGAPLTFTRSASYQSQLQDFVPPPAGEHWVGYISNAFTRPDEPDTTPTDSATISVDFALPRGANGGPFQGPFHVRPVVGVRNSFDPSLDARPVSCGDNVYGGYNSGSGSAVCIDSPSPSATNADLEGPTRDLGVIGSVAVGGTGRNAVVPFNAKYAGAADPGATFTLSAATDVPGGTATPSSSTLTPGSDSDNPVSVTVSVPKSAKAGDYKVTLTARTPGGEVRVGTSTLQVHDKTVPTARSLKLSPSSFRPLASPASIAKVARRTRVSYRLSEAAKVKFTVQRCTKRSRGKCRRYKTAKGSFSHSGKAGTNRFRFTGYLRGKALKRGFYRLVGVPTDKSKNKGKSVRANFRIR